MRSANSSAPEATVSLTASPGPCAVLAYAGAIESGAAIRARPRIAPISLFFSMALSYLVYHTEKILYEQNMDENFTPVPDFSFGEAAV